MADDTIDGLTTTTTPASTDAFPVLQTGGATMQSQTRAQLHTLESGEHFTLPQDNDAATPSLSFGDGNTGIFESADNTLGISIEGNNRWVIDNLTITGNSTSSGTLNRVGVDATTPGFTFNGDLNTGVGRGADDACSIIAGGVEAMRFTEATGVLQAVQADVGLTAHTDSNQGSGPILSSYNVYDIVGTAGDAATLPGTFVVGTLIYVKNGAAANSMDIFPTLGDDAGAGTDTVVALAAGDFKVFLGTTANATWEQILGGTA